MKIRRVAPWIVTVPSNRQYVFVQVETNEGLTGWGEITGTGALPNRSEAAVVREMSSFLEGEDPSQIEGDREVVMGRWCAPDDVRVGTGMIPGCLVCKAPALRYDGRTRAEPFV